MTRMNLNHNKTRNKEFGKDGGGIMSLSVVEVTSGGCGCGCCGHGFNEIGIKRQNKGRNKSKKQERTEGACSFYFFCFCAYNGREREIKGEDGGCCCGCNHFWM